MAEELPQPPKPVTSPEGEVYQTRSGRALTDADIEALAVDAERVRSIGHLLSRAQIRKHGRDRFPTPATQMKHLAGEIAELAIEVGALSTAHAADFDKVWAAIKREYADVGLSYYALGDKLGIDADTAMAELVRGDERDFSHE